MQNSIDVVVVGYRIFEGQGYCHSRPCLWIVVMSSIVTANTVKAWKTTNSGFKHTCITSKI